MQSLPFGLQQAKPVEVTAHADLTQATYSPEQQINLLDGVPLVDAAAAGRTDYWTEYDGTAHADKD